MLSCWVYWESYWTELLYSIKTYSCKSLEVVPFLVMFKATRFCSGCDEIDNQKDLGGVMKCRQNLEGNTKYKLEWTMDWRRGEGEDGCKFAVIRQRKHKESKNYECDPTFREIEWKEGSQLIHIFAIRVSLGTQWLWNYNKRY